MVGSLLSILLGWSIWVFPKIGVPQNGWFIVENLIEMDDLGGTIIFGDIHFNVRRSMQFVWISKRKSVREIHSLAQRIFRAKFHPPLTGGESGSQRDSGAEKR